VARQKTRNGRVLRLRQLRRERELTLEGLGTLVGLNGKTIGSFEQGRANPSFESALAIARVFGKSVEEVFSWVDVEPVVTETRA